MAHSGENDSMEGPKYDMLGFVKIGSYFQSNRYVGQNPNQGCVNADIVKFGIRQAAMFQQSFEICAPAVPAPPTLMSKLWAEGLPISAGVIAMIALGISIPPALTVPLMPVVALIVSRGVNKLREIYAFKNKGREIKDGLVPSIFRARTNDVPIQSEVEDAYSQPVVTVAWGPLGPYYVTQQFLIAGGAPAEPSKGVQKGQKRRWFNGDLRLKETIKQYRKFYEQMIRDNKLPQDVFASRQEFLKFAQRNVQFMLGSMYNQRFSIMNTIVPGTMLLTGSMIAPFAFGGTAFSALLGGMAPALVTMGLIQMTHYGGVFGHIYRQFYEEVGITPEEAMKAMLNSENINGNLTEAYLRTLVSYNKDTFNITMVEEIPTQVQHKEEYFNFTSTRAAEELAYVNMKNRLADKSGKVETWRSLLWQKVSRRISEFYLKAPHMALVMSWATVFYSATLMLQMGQLTLLPMLLCSAFLVFFAHMNNKKQNLNLRKFNHQGMVAVVPQKAYENFHHNLAKDKKYIINTQKRRDREAVLTGGGL
jgi:hypothetical protein